MKAVSAMMPASVNSFATSPMRRMFSVRSAGEKPRFLLRPWRTLSPSRTKACTLRSQSAFSSATAMVDFPEPERPVNQTVALRCPLRRSRSARVTAPWCQTMLVAFCSAIGPVLYRSRRGLARRCARDSPIMGDRRRNGDPCRQARIGHRYQRHEAERQHARPARPPEVLLVVERPAGPHLRRRLGDGEREHLRQLELALARTPHLAPPPRHDVLDDRLEGGEPLRRVRDLRRRAEDHDRAVVERVME